MKAGLFHAALIAIVLGRAPMGWSQDAATNDSNPISNPDVAHDKNKKGGGGGKKEPGERSKEIPLEPAPAPTQVRFEGSHLVINVPVARSGTAYVTVVELPEQGIKEIVFQFRNEEVSVDHVGAKVFIKLLQKAEGFLDVIGDTGTLYRLLIKPVTSGVFDSTVIVESKMGSQIGLERKPSHKETSETLELIEAMASHAEFKGADRSICDRMLGAQDDLEKRLVMMYETPNLSGYIIKVTNVGKETKRLDLKQYSGAGLVAVAASNFVLAPGACVEIYCVYVRD